MPNNSGATKSKMRSISIRKPLRDVSNTKFPKKPASIYKKTSQENEEQIGDDPLDRLLLVQSDLSALLRQIDELVVQALQLSSKKGRKEIKQFADVLSEMQTSLKPWVPRFQKALSSQSTGLEDKSEQPIERIVCVPKEDKSAVVDSPEQTKWESLVSPSPLVSWRAECNTEGGRQLFLLTPLPRTKTLSSLPASEQIKPDESSHPVSHFNSVGNLHNNLSEGTTAKSTPNKGLDIEVTKSFGNLETVCASPAKFSRTNCSMFVLTPRLKISPPKSCILLEPLSEFSLNKNERVHKCTPFPVGVHSFGDFGDSESSSSHSSDDLTTKYPELYGIKLAHNLGHRMKVVEDSPNWIISPPKTCAIMEPSDEKFLTNLAGKFLLPETASIHNQQADLSSMKESDYRADHGIATKAYHQQDTSVKLDLDENTPMIKEPPSSFRMGKHPGENTLKKELWTKFEAACAYGIHFSSSILQETAKKGFLDQLDEASDA